MTEWIGLLDCEGVEVHGAGYARQAYLAGRTVTFAPAQEDWGVVGYAALYRTFGSTVPREVIDLNVSGPQQVQKGDYVSLRLHAPPQLSDWERSAQNAPVPPVVPTSDPPDDPDVDADGFNWRTGRYVR